MPCHSLYFIYHYVPEFLYFGTSPENTFYISIIHSTMSYAVPVKGIKTFRHLVRKKSHVQLNITQ